MSKKFRKREVFFPVLVPWPSRVTTLELSSEVIIVPKSAKNLETNEEFPKTNVEKTNRQKALVIKVYYGCIYLIAIIIIIISCINFQT